MSRFNTGNPLGSGSPLDLDDNAKNMDEAVNAPQDTFQDRLGKSRLTWAGMENRFESDQSEREVQFDADQSSREQEFDAAQAERVAEFNADQTSREQQFHTFIASSGYQFAGDYVDGIEITQYNQIIRDSNGEFWRVSGQVDLPYVTTGAGLPENDSLVPAGEAVLRQDLANPDQGAAMVAFVGPSGEAHSLADLANPDKGAAMIGYMGRTLAAELTEHGVSLGGWAKGDGTDESAQINAWLDYIHANSLTGIIPSGTFVGRMLRLQAGHRIVGAPGATLKLPPNSVKFARLLTTEANLWRSTSPTSDSPIIYIRGVRFDGNRANQGDYLSHQKEQQMLLALDGGASTEFGQYRLRVIVDSCDFVETCSDGVSVYRSVDVSVINSEFDNCFRGSVVVIGGNSVVRVANIKAGGDVHSSFFQSEVEGTLPVDITLTNSTFETLRGQPLTGTGLDIGVKAGSNVTVNNCVMRAGLIRIDGFNRTSVINVSDSIIYNIGSTDHLVRYGQASFDNVEFIHANNATEHTISTRALNGIGLRARFTNCRFRFANDPMAAVTPIGITSAVTASVGGLTTLNLTLAADHELTFSHESFSVVEVSGLSPSEYNGRYWAVSGPTSNQINLLIQEIYGPIEVGSASIKICPMYSAIYNYSEYGNGLENKLTVQGCEFDYPYLEAVSLTTGGRLVMHSNDIESFSIARIISTASRFVDASIGEQSRIGLGCRFMSYVTATGTGVGSLVTLDTEGLALPARSSGVRATYSTLAGVTFKGQRLIYGNQAPLASMRRLSNDVYRRDAAPFGTPSLWQATTVTNGLASAWRQRQQTIGRGDTAARPTLTASDVGCQYLDNTLAAGGQSIFWNGTAWVDSTGTVV